MTLTDPRMKPISAAVHVKCSSNGRKLRIPLILSRPQRFNSRQDFAFHPLEEGAAGG
jgi:hypothetical protein